MNVSQGWLTWDSGNWTCIHPVGIPCIKPPSHGSYLSTLCLKICPPFYGASACYARRAQYCFTNSICLSVSLSNAGIVSRWMHIQFLNVLVGASFLVFFSPNAYNFVSTSASDWLERLVSEMTYNVLMGTLNPTNSLTPLHNSIRTPFVGDELHGWEDSVFTAWRYM